MNIDRDSKIVFLLILNISFPLFFPLFITQHILSEFAFYKI